MSITLWYYNIVIPIINIAKCPELNNLDGTLSYYSKRNKSKCIWYDDKLFTIGGIMGPMDVETECLALEKLGLNLNKEIDGQQHWDDLCVVDFVSGPTLPCSWLECHINPYQTSYAWLKNKKMGQIIGPNQAKVADL